MRINALHYDAFASEPGNGNPAGLVLDADALTEAQMQAIAHAVGFSETAFVLRSDRADFRLRYFTPGHEVDLCGHATIAALYALYTRGMLPAEEHIVETNAGALSMTVSDDDGVVSIGMAQPNARFTPFEGDPAAVAGVLGLKLDDLASGLPLVYGNTGLWTLIVPVRGLAAMRRIRPETARFPAVLAQMPRVSIHPFCFETIDTSADMHGRHFSSPYSGTIEDPVTGTASGVMGAYYAKYSACHDGQYDLTVEQGQELGRDGRVRVHVTAEGSVYRVQISGTAVYVKEMAIDTDG